MKISAQYVVSNSVRHLKIRRLNACRRQIGVVGGKIVVFFFSLSLSLISQVRVKL